MTDPAKEAAAAARRAKRRVEDIPNAALSGQPIGICRDCETRFEYGRGSGVGNLDPCPECGGREWEKWGYRYDGDELRRDEAWGRYDPPFDPSSTDTDRPDTSMERSE